jgi:hypothetical protein
MKTLFNGQFDFDSNAELDLVLDNLNPQMAIKIIEIGIHKGLSEGIFDLTEAHCLYKSIQRLKNVENEKIKNDDNTEQ